MGVPAVPVTVTLTVNPVTLLTVVTEGVTVTVADPVPTASPQYFTSSVASTLPNPVSRSYPAVASLPSAGKDESADAIR